MERNDKITAIIVLYKMDIDNCLTYKTLSESVRNSRLSISLIFYNNYNGISLEGTQDYLVVNAKDNEKLYGAYNFGLAHAKENDNSWLLLLDQDTEVTKEYVLGLESVLFRELDDSVVAIVPILKSGNIILSPKIISQYGWWQNDIKIKECVNERVSAFNSLSLVSVNFFESIGGFSCKYKLDMLDHWYYNQIYRHKKKVFVLDTKIEHNLSLLNYENEMSISRHCDFLNAEYMFVKEELSLLHYITYKMRLIARFFKQLLFFNNKKYSVITLKRIVNTL